MSQNSKPKKPFYKKWWFWVIVAFLVIGGIGSLGDSNKKGSSAESSSKSSSSSSKTSSQASADLKKAKSDLSKSVNSVTHKSKTKSKAIPGIGQDVKVGKLVYKVNNVTTAKQVGPSVLPETAQDTFLVVDLSVTNNDSKSVKVDSSYFNLVDGSKTFKADSKASLSANQGEDGNITNSFFMQDLNPEVSMNGKIVFSVSAQEAASTSNRLKVQTGYFGTQTAEIKLH